MPSYKKTITGLTALLALFVIGEMFGYDSLTIGIPKAFAEGAPTDNIYTTMVGYMAVFIALVNTLSFIVYPILIAVVDPRFFLGIHQANEGTILQIWQMSRDIMNVIFAFLLIAGACLTVVTAKKDIISKFAIKFVLGVILVNFSWFFPRVILDVAHVLTASIYQLPGMVATSCAYYDNLGNIQSPCKYPYDFKFFDEAQNIADSDVGPAALGFECPTSTVCYRVDSLAPLSNTATGMLSGLIMNHAHLPNLSIVQNFNAGGLSPTSAGDLVSFFLQFIVNTGFLIILSVALFLVMVAMLVAFIIRIPVLWMTMAFMPFMFLGFVIGEKMGNFNTMKIFDHFVKAAFLPAVTAIPLAVGFIVLNSLAFSPPPAGLPPGMADLLAPSAPMGQFLPGVDNLWILLWNIMTILIIWKGFFAALAIDEIYANATKGIQSFGGSLAGLALTAPLNIPIPGLSKTNADGTVTQPTFGQVLNAPRAAAGLSKTGNLSLEGLQSQLGLGGGVTVSNETRVAIQNLNPDSNGKLSDDEIRRLGEKLAKDDKLKDLSYSQKVEKIRQDLINKGVKVDDDTRDKLIEQMRIAGGGGVRNSAQP
ncbi:hypothetical protein COU78_02770 [Candidatus Peregrinibacteria bacterium CG10_big_fil_rev_8_21_14_0_10_49_24]|nr:MAG: hypothetical protein COV83_02750 [Candidatus Peregrinibacteria bacterium CG11_big_fil_rev_8_21_14_0_20_49_14]PIR51058.1 MAG: hypothetical protein COU78_02770 [Candidatus Peregrinibacteria bacterium CG10_big_fil_rev_8_21_14_0_10_49_24]PJA67611.1 MAG: hypothetical protein CO157_04250 [Candidatus Peregrinibacteria bacterium CG_4_9_14_3_um_filter_49_12]